jgi:hypothetical protein
MYPSPGFFNDDDLIKNYEMRSISTDLVMESAIIHVSDTEYTADSRYAPRVIYERNCVPEVEYER